MFWRYMLPGFCWALLILVLSMTPGSRFPKFIFPELDKIAHIGMYAILLMLLLWGFYKQMKFKCLHTKATLVALSAATVFGILIEVIQGTVFATRSMEVADILANSIGCLLGLIGYLLISHRKDLSNGTKEKPPTRPRAQT